MFVSALVLLGSLALVTVGAELLVKGAAHLAERAGISPLFIGLTIVGFGTSSPELAASLTATANGLNDVSVGNVVGSNIFNIAIILGLASMVHPIRMALTKIRGDLLIAFGAALFPYLALVVGPKLADGRAGVGVALGVLGLVVLVSWIAGAWRASRKAGGDQVNVEDQASLLPRGGHVGLDVLWIAAGLTLLVFGSKWFVEAATGIARDLGMSELVVGLTIVAGGTSLPELLTSVVAARRGQPELSVGNVIGSNIFNTFGILAACALVSPQAVSSWTFQVDLPFLGLLTLSLWFLFGIRGGIDRKMGAALFTSWIVYLIHLILRGG